MSSRLHRRTCSVVARPRPAPCGGGRGGTAAGGQPRGGTDWREAGRGRASVCMRTPAKDAPRRSFAVQLWSTPDRYAPGSKLCRYERPSRRQAHSVRRALSYPGVDGGGTRPRCGTRDVCADLARNPHVPCYRFPSSCRRRGAPAEGAAQRVCAESVLLSAATETATTPAYSTPTPSETTTTPVARQGPFLRHFGQAGAVGVSQNPQAGDAGAVGVSQNPQAGDAGAVGVSSSDPAAPRDGGDVTDCRLSREAPAR